MTLQKTAKPIELSFGRWYSRVGPTYHVLDTEHTGTGATWRISLNILLFQVQAVDSTSGLRATADGTPSIGLLAADALKCYIKCSLMKTSPVRCGLSSKYFDYLLV